MRLAAKIGALAGLAAALTAALVSVAVLRLAERELIGQATDALLLGGRLSEVALDQWIDGSRRQLGLLVQRPQLRDGVRALVAEQISEPDRTRLLASHLEPAVLAGGWRDVWLFDAQSGEVRVASEPARVGTVQPPPSGHGEAELRFDPNRLEVELRLVVPVLGEFGEPLMLLGAALDWAVAERVLHTVALSNPFAARMRLAYHDGTTLADSAAAGRAGRPDGDADAEPVGCAAGGPPERVSLGERTIRVSLRRAELPMCVVIDAARELVLAPIADLRREGLLATAALTLLAVLVGILSARLMAQRVRRLIGASNAIAGGRLDTRIELRGGDELRELGDAMDAMAQRLSETMASRDQLEKEVAARARFERLLRKSARRLALAARAGGIGMWSCDPVRGEQSWDEPMRAHLGVGPEVPASRAALLERVHPEDRARVAAGFERWSCGETGEDLEFRVRRADGSVRHLLAAAAREIDAEAARGTLVGVCVDLSERIAQRDALAAQAEELRRSNRDLEQFAYIASHDLQEPLRMVSGFCDLLARRYAGRLDDKADQYIGFATDGARRMQAMIRDLLSFSRVSTRGRPLVPCDPRTVLDTVLRDLQPRIEECGGTIRVEGQLPPLQADPGQLAQVFANLLGNGLKFHRQGAKPQVSVRAAEDGERVRFEVADNGIGIAREHAERIFQIFQRLNERERFEGSGIGLAIVKRIVERHGGSIACAPNPAGAGSVFSFTMPRSGAPRGIDEVKENIAG